MVTVSIDITEPSVLRDVIRPDVVAYDRVVEESPVDLSEIVWVADQRGSGPEPDAAHRAQLEERERDEGERAVFAHQRQALGEVYEAAEESTRGLLALVGRLVHDLRPMHNVRHHSEVRHFAWHSFDELTRAIGESGPFVLKVGRVRLRCGPGRIKAGPFRYEADGRLHLPVSRPDLLVRVVIEPWWRNRSAVTLSLRPSRRMRYPRRYFEAAHGVVSEITTAPASRIGAPTPG